MKIKDINEDMSLLDLISAGTLVAGGVAGHIGMDKYLQWKKAKQEIADAKAKREAARQAAYAERERQRTDPELIAARKKATAEKRKATIAKSKAKQARLDALAKDVFNPYTTKKEKKGRVEFVSGTRRPSEIPSTPIRKSSPARSRYSSSRSSYSSPTYDPSDFGGGTSGGSNWSGGGGGFGGGGASGSW